MTYARGVAAASLAISLAVAVPCRGQAVGRPGVPGPEVGYADAVAQWIALPATPGHERIATDVIAASMPGWARDSVGNLVMRRGTGAPRRVVACGLDEAAYVVSEIRDDGYLRLQTSGRARRSALWDQFHEGQRIRIITRTGELPAVVAVRSTHLWRTRNPNESVVTVDQLWVDAGARSRADVTRLGIAVLDPVVHEWPVWRYADVVAGPAAAERAGCAAVASSAGASPERGETIWVLSAQHAFGYQGLAAVLNRVGSVDSLFIVDPVLVRDTAVGASDTATRRSVTVRRIIPGAVGQIGAAVAIGARSTFPGTLVESVRGDDIGALVQAVRAAAGVPSGQGTVLVGLTGVPTPPPTAPTVADSLTSVARLLAELSDVYAVSGREAPLRTVVAQEIPAAWRHQPTRVDSAGDLIVEAGPDRDTLVIVAHLDELGFQVTGIRPDGSVTLRPLGGFYSSLWEGQPALLHLDGAPGQGSPGSCGAAVVDGSISADRRLRGVFVPRARAVSKEPDSLTAWFGVDSAALGSCGVAVGTKLSGYKRASRLGNTRFTARALDDRVGCTALLLALRDVDPARFRHKVIFVWSVREETGLEGATVVARSLGSTVHRVHAIDTFVSSDSPLETTRFADATVGAGAALRALDNSSVTPPGDVARVVRIAAAGAIPLQVGTTNGGNDGSAFVPWGAVDVPVGWPLRYSHSPAELVDLRDVHALAQLVAALAVADPAF
jgi:putative aminopeptidase FrvX